MKKDYFNLIRTKYRAILLIVSFFVALTLFITSQLPFQYESSAQLLVIQEEASGDLYQASKAAESLGLSLSKVIYTSSFYEKVLASKMIDESYFSSDESKRRSEWNDSIKAEIVPQTSILKIYAYSTDRNKAENLASGISYVLSTRGDEYYGEGNKVAVKIVNQPLTSNRPVKPNLVLNLLVGIVIGLVVSVVYVMFVDYNLRARKSGLEPKPEPRQNPAPYDSERNDNERTLKADLLPVYNVLEAGNFRQLGVSSLESIEPKPLFSMQDHFQNNIIQ